MALYLKDGPRGHFSSLDLYTCLLYCRQFHYSKYTCYLVNSLSIKHHKLSLSRFFFFFSSPYPGSCTQIRIRCITLPFSLLHLNHKMTHTTHERPTRSAKINCPVNCCVQRFFLIHLLHHGHKLHSHFLSSCYHWRMNNKLRRKKNIHSTVTHELFHSCFMILILTVK